MPDLIVLYNKPMNNNPKLDEFKNILIRAKQGHMHRIVDYSRIVFTDKNNLDFSIVPGKHNDGLMARVYHAGFMNALNKNHGAEKAHDFLINNHPFYSKDWYKKSVPTRKIETALKGLSWFLK